MIPISKKFRDAEVYLYLPDQDEKMIHYIFREMRKLKIHPSLVSSLSSISIDDRKNSFLILKQSTYASCKEQADFMFLSDHILLIMKNSETIESKYYNYHQMYPKELQKLLDHLKTAYDNFEYSDLNRCSILMYNCL